MTRLEAWWGQVWESLWFLPALLTVAAALLAALTVELDKALLADQRASFYFGFSGGAAGARGVLTAIAGSVITVTGVIFSITIVALQLASSQFSPRVLRQFTSDRVNQVVLGVFIGTFTYTLLVLRTVRSAGDDGQLFVPSLSVATSILLALASIGFLIFFIHHSARSIRISVILDRATADTLALVVRLFPDPIGEAETESAEPTEPAGRGYSVFAREAGYLQAVDEDALAKLAERANLVIRVESHVGELVLPDAAVASVWSGEALGDEAREAVRRALVLGPERTLQQDIELGVRQIADIGLKALSPGINDPTTAMACVDRLAQVFVTLGNRRTPQRVRRGAGDGRVLSIAPQWGFDRLVEVGFAQLRHYGKGDAEFACHFLEAMGRVAALVPLHRRPPLGRQIEAAYRSARMAIDEPVDQASLERAAKHAVAALGAVHLGARSPER